MSASNVDRHGPRKLGCEGRPQMESGEMPSGPAPAVSATPIEFAATFGPYPEAEGVFGVSYDGERVWIATGRELRAINPQDGSQGRAIQIAATAGTAFDGEYLYQLGSGVINKIDPLDGSVVHTIDAPIGEGDTGMAFAEGSLWVGHFHKGCIHRIDPHTGDVQSTLHSDRWVTGVSFMGAHLWHGSVAGEEPRNAQTDAEMRRVDTGTGEVRERLKLPPSQTVSGIAAGKDGEFYCGGGPDRCLRVLRTKNDLSAQ